MNREGASEAGPPGGVEADDPAQGEVGRSVPPLGWRARTSGLTEYAHDVTLPGMLIGAILRSPYAHARLLSIDTARARQMPGVHAVITSADVAPGKTYIHHGGELSDRPPFAADMVRFIGQEVAAVASEDRRTAMEALAAISVRYRRKRAPLSIRAALRPNAPTLHARGPGLNLALDERVAWGDVDAVVRDAALVSTGTYRYPQITHVSMETNVTVASWREHEQRLELWTSTQSPYFVRKEVAHVLDLPVEQIVLHPVAVGGGFGAKSKIAEHEVIAALLSMRSGHPVKLMLSREEEFLATKSRHEFLTSISVALDGQNNLSGFDADVLVDNGAFNHTGPSVMRAGISTLGLLYRPQAARARGRLVDTAKVPGGQFRGYGMPQVAFALESEIDEAARRAGLDPIELRMRNANLPNQTTLSGARILSASMRECLSVARDAIGWEEKRRNPTPGRGLGIAVAIHGSGVFADKGANRSGARIEIDGDGRVRVRFGGSDPGTGQRTLLAQIAAEELGISAEAVDVQTMDLTVTPTDMGAWSSRGTHFGGNAVRKAARAAADELLEAAREKFATDEVWLESGMVRTREDALRLGELVGTMPRSDQGVFACEAAFEDMSVDPTETFVRPDSRANVSPSYAFAAHAVEVEADTGTGQIKVLDYVAVHDAGRVLNPAQAEGQVIGGVVMGLGAALREELIFHRGRVVNPSYMHYGVPRAPDVPRVRVIFVGEADPSGPFGAKNVGEISTIPVAPAVANAVRDATGIRVRELPITPEKIVGQPLRPPLPVWRRPGRWWTAAMRWAYPRGVEAALHRWGTRLRRQPASTARIEHVARPVSAHQVINLAAGGYRPVGGATELQLLRRQGLSNASHLVALGGVHELSTIDHDNDGTVVVGAGVTLRALAEYFDRRVPAIARAVDTIASPQIRVMATVAGNLLQEKRCWFFRNGFECYKRSGPASPCYAIRGDHRFYHATMDAHRCQAVTPSDLATVFTALDAHVELVSTSGRRHVALSDLYTGPGETCLAEDEILWTLRIPSTSLHKSIAFEKLQLWSGDFAVTAVALAVDIDRRGAWRDVRLCVGGLAPTPWTATGTARALEGVVADETQLERALGDELAQRSHPLSHNGWKIRATCTLANRAARSLLASRHPREAGRDVGERAHDSTSGLT